MAGPGEPSPHPGDTLPPQLSTPPSPPQGLALTSWRLQTLGAEKEKTPHPQGMPQRPLGRKSAGRGARHRPVLLGPYSCFPLQGNRFLLSGNTQPRGADRPPPAAHPEGPVTSGRKTLAHQGEDSSWGAGVPSKCGLPSSADKHGARLPQPQAMAQASRELSFFI